jgi:hypothetical protein
VFEKKESGARNSEIREWVREIAVSKLGKGKWGAPFLASFARSGALSP